MSQSTKMEAPRPSSFNCPNCFNWMTYAESLEARLREAEKELVELRVKLASVTEGAQSIIVGTVKDRDAHATLVEKMRKTLETVHSDLLISTENQLPGNGSDIGKNGTPLDLPIANETFEMLEQSLKLSPSSALQEFKEKSWREAAMAAVLADWPKWNGKTPDAIADSIVAELLAKDKR